METSKIRDLAKIRGVSIDELIDESGVKRSTFFNYLSGKTEMPASVLGRIAKILDVSIDIFFDPSKNLEHLPDDPDEIKFLKNELNYLRRLRELNEEKISYLEDQVGEYKKKRNKLGE